MNKELESDLMEQLARQRQWAAMTAEQKKEAALSGSEGAAGEISVSPCDFAGAVSKRHGCTGRRNERRLLIGFFNMKREFGAVLHADNQAAVLGTDVRQISIECIAFVNKIKQGICEVIGIHGRSLLCAKKAHTEVYARKTHHSDCCDTIYFQPTEGT